MQLIPGKILFGLDSLHLEIFTNLNKVNFWNSTFMVTFSFNIGEVLALEPGRRYAHWGAHFSPKERINLYSDPFQASITESDPEGLFVKIFEATDAEDCTDAALDADVSLYLADDLLVKMDRATMAHSLEARSPLLDHVLMEFVATLPPHFKLSGKEKKYLLKACLRGSVPDAVLDRPKMGFCVPLARWFREDLREMAYDLLLSSRSIQRGYFRAGRVEDLLNDHCQAQADHAAQLWDLLVLELWHRTFIDSHPIESQSLNQPEQIVLC